MASSKNVNKIRRQLLDNGYTPLANGDKACYLKNWPRLEVDANTLARWSRMHKVTGTGMRVQDGLCIIDIDIDHRIIEDIAEVMLNVLPLEAQPHRLERAGKGHKLAWYCRTDDIFARLHTRRWIAPNADGPDDGTHSIEIFGGASPRQFGSFGPHTIDEEGRTVIAYKWAEETPCDVPLNELTVLSKAQLFEMLDAAEGELKRAGFEPVKRTKSGEGTPAKIYDLTSDMVFDLQGDGQVSYDALVDMVNDGYSGRCSAAWLEGDTASNTSRCLVSRSGSGHLSIWESAEGNTHLPSSIKPSAPNEVVDRILEAQKKSKDKSATKLNSEDDHITAAAKILRSYAFAPADTKTPIIPLWTQRVSAALGVSNFRLAMAPYCGIEVGPRGGEKKINPVDVWLGNHQRLLVEGTVMRPDRERPTFEEKGETWVNTYNPTDLGSADGGSADGGIALVENVVPDKRERAYFWQWIAYKWKNPHIPSVSVIMVAREYGTGRGTFGSLLEHMFGEAYVTNVSFDIFAGLCSQAQYTDWGLNALIAIVNESSAAGDTSVYRTKNKVYEHLKETVDPRPSKRLYIGKGVRAVSSVSATTNLIFTNNPDAIPLEANDRRFFVITNGGVPSPEFWEYINAWMGKAANIAEFARHAESIDLTGFNPYAMPPMTDAKREMTELNKSDLDRVLGTALASMEGVFVPEQVIARMSTDEPNLRMMLPDKWQAIVTRELRAKCYAPRYPSGRKIKMRAGTRSYDPYCLTRVEADKHTDASKIRRAVNVNGNVFGGDLA